MSVLSIQVLVSTMNQTDIPALVGEARINDCVVINQITDDIAVPKDNLKKSRIFLSYRGKGLSASRNLAISNSSADICIIADDDLYYTQNYEEIVGKAYQDNPDADIIAFYVDYDNAQLNRKPLQSGRIKLLKSMKISSVHISFRRESVVAAGVKFDEKFGAGSAYYMGEENIFLADCLRAGLKIYSVPVKIATLVESESTWFNGYDKYNFNVKGRVFYRISKVLALPLIFRFAIVKASIYRDEVHPVRALIYMLQGFMLESRRSKSDE